MVLLRPRAMTTGVVHTLVGSDTTAPCARSRDSGDGLVAQRVADRGCSAPRCRLSRRAGRCPGRGRGGCGPRCCHPQRGRLGARGPRVVPAGELGRRGAHVCRHQDRAANGLRPPVPGDRGHNRGPVRGGKRLGPHARVGTGEPVLPGRGHGPARGGGHPRRVGGGGPARPGDPPCQWGGPGSLARFAGRSSRSSTVLASGRIGIGNRQLRRRRRRSSDGAAVRIPGYLAKGVRVGDAVRLRRN